MIKPKNKLTLLSDLDLLIVFSGNILSINLKTMVKIIAQVNNQCFEIGCKIVLEITSNKKSPAFARKQGLSLCSIQYLTTNFFHSEDHMCINSQRHF
jgi:predicted RNA-binding protein Jag